MPLIKCRPARVYIGPAPFRQAGNAVLIAQVALTAAELATLSTVRVQLIGPAPAGQHYLVLAARADYQPGAVNFSVDGYTQLFAASAGGQVLTQLYLDTSGLIAESSESTVSIFEDVDLGGDTAGLWIGAPNDYTGGDGQVVWTVAYVLFS